MHHLVSGINSLILSVSLTSHVSTHLLIHLSAHLYYHYHSHHPSLLHSFIPGSKPTFSTNPFHLRLFLPSRQWDWTENIMLNLLIVLFLVLHFNFVFVPCGGLSWLPVSFLLHVKHTLSYRMCTSCVRVNFFFVFLDPQTVLSACYFNMRAGTVIARDTIDQFSFLFILDLVLRMN